MKARHIRIIEKLPVSELTDEEIAKAAMHRLDSKAVLLIYESEDRLNFIGRYRNNARYILTHLKHAYEEKYGKFKKEDKE